MLRDGFRPMSSHPPIPAAFMRLDHLRVLRISGAEAAAFLQGQLTCDVLAVPVQAVTLGAWCSAKGRALATFLLGNQGGDGGDYFLVLPAELAEPVAKRLSMFVLRAKARVELLPTAVFGLVGTEAAPVGLHLFGGLPQGIWEHVGNAGAQLVRVPDSVGCARWLALVAADQVAQLEAAATEMPAAATTDAALWRWLELRAALPMVLAATQDKFVPQMINLEALGAVNFRKGCYPGQEVVARSQYLGKLKRRSLLAHAASGAVAGAGSDVHDANGASVGTVVNAEPVPAGWGAGLDLLIEVPLDAASRPLFLPPGIPLTLLDLPYDLPDNEVFVRPTL